MNQAIAGHVCNYCHGINGKQTKENPRITDWCIICGHRGEGIRQAAITDAWGRIRVAPSHQSTTPPEAP